MLPSAKYPWTPRFEKYQTAIDYIANRREGKITSLKCALPKINDAATDGFEWHTAVCFAARPGGGKSVLKEQLIREFFEENPNEIFRVLDWDLEMLPLVTALREFSAVINKSYKYICSAEKDNFGNTIDTEELSAISEYVLRKKTVNGATNGLPIDVIETACTVREWEKTIEEYMEAYSSTDKDGKKQYTKTVISLDHARLLIRESQSEKEMLQDLGNSITRLKKKYPIIFLIFNHLNRNVTDPSRCEDGKIGNFLTDIDILGGDDLQQAMDILIAIDRPFNRRIKMYGPDRYKIDDPYILIYHFLKVRNGDVRMSFFRGEFDKMKIVEIPAPQTMVSSFSRK